MAGIRGLKKAPNLSTNSKQFLRGFSLYSVRLIYQSKFYGMIDSKLKVETLLLFTSKEIGIS